MCYIIFIWKPNTIIFPIAFLGFFCCCCSFPLTSLLPSLQLTSTRLFLQLAACLLFTLQQSYLYFQGSPEKDKSWRLLSVHNFKRPSPAFGWLRLSFEVSFGLKRSRVIFSRLLLHNSMHKLIWGPKELISFVPLKLSHKKTLPNRTSKNKLTNSISLVNDFLKIKY